MSRDERGLSESVQWAVLVPLVLLCLVGVIQGGIWWHGRIAAQEAAAGGADAAAIAGPAAAEAAARRIAQTADLRSVQVAVLDRGVSWEVVVTGRAQVVLDIGVGGVTGRAVAAKEE